MYNGRHIKLSNPPKLSNSRVPTNTTQYFFTCEPTKWISIGPWRVFLTLSRNTKTNSRISFETLICNTICLTLLSSSRPLLHHASQFYHHLHIYHLQLSILSIADLFQVRFFVLKSICGFGFNFWLWFWFGFLIRYLFLILILIYFFILIYIQIRLGCHWLLTCCRWRLCDT